MVRHGDNNEYYTDRAGEKTLLTYNYCVSPGSFDIKATKDGEGIKLSCSGGLFWEKNKGKLINASMTDLTLPYEDARSGEYECFHTDADADADAHAHTHTKAV